MVRLGHISLNLGVLICLAEWLEKLKYMYKMFESYLATVVTNPRELGLLSQQSL